MSDVGSRVRAEELKEASHRTVETLINNLPGLVYRCEPSTCNPSADASVPDTAPPHDAAADTAPPKDSAVADAPAEGG